MELKDLASEINRRYPTRDWDQQCQRLVWNVIQILTGTSDNSMITYPTATAARLASSIESTNPGSAPVGAIHYWLRPAEGHVAVSLGGSSVLMTGTPHALGTGGYQLGKNYGVTTVQAYGRQMGNPYLGWSRRNGSNPSIENMIGSEPKKEAEDMPVLIKHPNTSIGLVTDAGDLVPISNMNQVNSLRATIVTRDIITLPNPQIWNELAALTAQKKSNQGQVDSAKLASDIAALLVAPVVEALKGVGSLTKEDVESAVASVTRAMLEKAVS